MNWQIHINWKPLRSLLIEDNKPFFTGVLASAADKISQIRSGEVFLAFFFVNI